MRIALKVILKVTVVLLLLAGFINISVRFGLVKRADEGVTPTGSSQNASLLAIGAGGEKTKISTTTANLCGLDIVWDFLGQRVDVTNPTSNIVCIHARDHQNGDVDRCLMPNGKGGWSDRFARGDRKDMEGTIYELRSPNPSLGIFRPSLDESMGCEGKFVLTQ